MRTVLAGDLGGTKCRFGLVAADFSVHCTFQIATIRERGPFLAEFDRALRHVLETRPPELEPPIAAGFGTAGVVVPTGGRIEDAPNLPLGGYPLAQHVLERTGLPATLINDGRASAWGEFVRGAAAGSDPLLCLFFGTGIGIGLIYGGSPYRGAANAAGEIGHTVYVPDGRLCPCGAAGHFEAWCGGRAITERAAEMCGVAPTGRWTVGDLVAAAARGDEIGIAASRILDEAALAAGTLVSNACTLLNPAAVVLGGGMLTGWPALRGRIEDHVRGTTRRLIHDDLRFVPSLGGSDAVLFGAALATGVLGA
ncbi:MAG: ROK family protein [Planctomycetes bacterium]|nr:ROK family protein [Planctomycetota bacterium]